MIKKTSIVTFIGILLLLNCIAQSSAISSKKDIETINVETESLDLTEVNQTYHLVMTYGPAWMRIFTKIELINGDEDQINELNDFLTRGKLPEIIEPIEVEELTFKVTYRLPVTIFSRFTYYTANTTDFDPERLEDPEYIDYLIEVAKNLNNYSSITRNRRHSLTFENFTGIFYLVAPKFIRVFPPKFFIPAKFIFVGACENIVEN